MQNIFHTPDYSPKNLSALIPKSHNDKAPGNHSLPMAASSGATTYTLSRTAQFQLNSRTRKRVEKAESGSRHSKATRDADSSSRLEGGGPHRRTYEKNMTHGI
ncbi:MAG: hypothetical protein J2P21_12370 [Chloracidobacterium sp.]|nr:hypothetical protein [Chloracidobacterium sp.]